MNKEQYVSFEVAKLLKQKGFDWPCIFYYEDNGIMHRALDYVRQNDGDDDDNDECLCPTQQMACRWLREEHKIHITDEPLETFKQERIVYEPIIYMLNDFDDFALEYKTVHLKECNTNEDAIEAALQYVLNNLI